MITSDMITSGIKKLDHMARERGKPFRVLIVDDEKWVGEVFKDFCEVSDAFKVDLVADGVIAIEKAQASTYDLITLDLIMPEISGLEVLTAIKESSPAVPIMIITGNATEKLVNEAGDLGACKVLYKPVQMDIFITELTATLER